MQAIVFHDVVYETPARHKGANEEDSAQYFVGFCESLPAVKGLQKIQGKVESYILATIDHAVSGSKDTDLQLFIDIDMAVLGRDVPGYREYASQIRKEYSHSPARLYCRSRASFLERTVADQDTPIFASETFRKLYEVRARENLSWEVTQLNAGRIPGGEILVPISDKVLLLLSAGAVLGLLAASISSAFLKPLS